MRRLVRSFTSRAASEPFEIGLSIALVLFGGRALLDGLSSAPGSVQALPLPLALGYCALAILGGGAALGGVFARRVLDWAYGLERFGLFVSAGAWSAYVVGLLLGSITSRSTLLILALAALAIACLIRARTIDRDERAVLVALRVARESND